MHLDFPINPVLGQKYPDPPVTNTPVYMWDGEKWVAGTIGGGSVRYDSAQNLTAAQQAQARANIGVPAKNYILNGAMLVSQENQLISGITTQFYPADMFSMNFSNAGVQSVQWLNNFPTSVAASTYRIRVTCSTADAALAAGDFNIIATAIEGMRVADLRLGSAHAKTVTLRFGVRAPAGTYCVAFQNNAQDRNYVAEYVISAAESNIDVIKTITLPLDVAGTWLVNTGVGLRIFWTLMSGSAYLTTPGSWKAGGLHATANQFNLMGVAGASFDLFDVGLYEGSFAPPYVLPHYETELAACRRYWESGRGNFEFYPVSAGGVGWYGTVTFSVQKRAIPSMAYPNWSYYSGGLSTVLPAGQPQLHSASVDAGRWMANSMVNVNGMDGTGTWTANARL